MRRNSFANQLSALVLISGAGGLLAGCEETSLSPLSRSVAPIPPQTIAAMEALGSSKSAPILIRAYKKEAELEIWKKKPDGRYAYLKTFPMCRWSGQLGPKLREGDRQVPEGFYSITPARMNPRSAYYLSFDVGYPNTFDRANGRTGGSIMVHGACSSAGCFSMTDGQIAEIYAIAREAFDGGQHAIQMQSYPFRMTAENLAKYRLDPNIGFWKQLKEGSDNFEVTKQEVAVGVCNKHYVFNAVPADGSHLDPAGPCPALKQNEEVQKEVVAKQQRDEAKIAELTAQGVRPVRTVYADGGQHPDFAWQARYASRPEALAQGPVDVAIEDVKQQKKGKAGAAAKLAASKATLVTAAADAAGKESSRPAEAAAKAAEADPESKPLYVSLISRFWGGSTSETQPVNPGAAPAAALEAAPQTATVPVPPKRNAPPPAAAQPRDANVKPQNSVSAPAAVKPQAALARPAEPAKTVALLRAGGPAAAPETQ